MRRFLSKWYLYLLAIIISVSAFCILTNIKTNPKRTERINFIVACYDAQVYKLEQALKEKKPDYLKEINCTYLNIDADNFGYLFYSLRGDADFFILPINYVDNNQDSTIKYAANIIDTNYVDNKLNAKQEYYSYEGYSKGFKIYDSLLDEGILKDYLTYNVKEEKSDYYLFFNYNSPNVGSLNNSESEVAFDAIKTMFIL